LVVRHLGDVRVLAEEAFEIASHGGDGVGAGSWKEVKQGLFFDGVAMAGNYLTINKTD